MQAALLAERGVDGPPNVIEGRDGFMQAFAYDASKARPVELPPTVPFGITDCYIKPNPCCRHLQPAVEALIGILNDEKIATDEVRQVAVETYRIAAEHAATGWDDFASSQLSFRYLMALALKYPQHQVRLFLRRGARAIRAGRRSPQNSRSARRTRSTGSIQSCARRG